MQVRTPPFPRNQAAQRQREKVFPVRREQNCYSLLLAHTQLVVTQEVFHIWSMYSKARSGTYCTKEFECKVLSSIIDKNPVGPDYICANNNVEDKRTESVLFSFCLSQKTEETTKQTQSSATKEEEMRVWWSIQCLHFKPPFFPPLF